MMLCGAAGDPRASCDHRHRGAIPAELAEALDSGLDQPLSSSSASFLLWPPCAHGALSGSTQKSSWRSASRSASRYFAKSLTPAAASTSSSMKKLPVTSALGLVRIV